VGRSPGWRSGRSTAPCNVAPEAVPRLKGTVVLAEALRLHLEHRVIVYGRRTAVFD